MFSGIISAVGMILRIIIQKDVTQLIILKPASYSDLMIGESIAINGVCLTLTDFSSTEICFTVVPETLRVTNLGLLQEGSPVNLERSITLQTRLGGHYVQGHV